MIDIQKHFPANFKPTEQQTDTIKKIADAFKTHKFVICCAPTGTGKSFLAKTIANSSSDCTEEFKHLITSYKAYSINGGEYVHEEKCLEQGSSNSAALTMTKQLQDQYQELFTDALTLKGKNNYVCSVDEDKSVDIAPCILLDKLKKDCWTKNICPYYNARNDALLAKFAVYNYKMFLCLPDHVKQKDFLICDEAAELEDELVHNFSVDIRNKTLKSLLGRVYDVDVNNNSSVYRYINVLIPTIHDVVEELGRKNLNKKTKQNQNELQKLIIARNLHSQLENIQRNWSNCEYVAEETKNGIVISPLRVNNLANQLFDCAKKVLLMSATIIDPAKFAESLGITEYKYIEVPSEFDPKKAPIVVSSKYKMNKKNWETIIPIFKQTIIDICKRHPNEKGIIHTHNMDITNYLKTNLRGDRFLFREDGIDNQNILNTHSSNTSNTVLVSPSMTHGVDLKDDLARFQIIVKAPFLPLNNKRIKKLFTQDGQWYVNKMLTTIIQASGRGIRSRDDYCTTYILDGNIAQSIVDNASKLPKYFLKRFL